MGVVGHRHVYRVNLVALLVEQFPPVGIPARTGHSLRRLIEIVGVHVAKRHDLQALVLQEVLQVHPTHAADADAGVVQFAVSRNLPGTRGRSTTGHEEWRSNPGGNCRAQELAS